MAVWLNRTVLSEFSWRAGYLLGKSAPASARDPSILASMAGLGAIAFALPQSGFSLYRRSHQRMMKNEESLMAWWFIFIADLFEMAWPFALKWSVKFSRWSPLIVAIVTSIPVMFLLAEAVKRLPAATVYAAFAGIGVAGTAIIGMTIFGESRNAGRICSLVLLLAGLIGLKLFSGPTE